MSDPVHPFAIGIDIGGTNIKAAAVDALGTVLARAVRSTIADVPSLISTVDVLVDRFTRGIGRRPVAVGIASPGLAAADNRTIAWMRGRMEAVERLNWQARLATDEPVFVLNDAHAATIGEAWRGALPGRQHVVMLTLGTGVGGGVIIDGKLVQGRCGRAGHLGHICLDPEGPADIVGTPGSLEDLVGDHTVRSRSDNRFADTAELVAAAAAGDRFAERIWQRTIHHLACGLVSLINAFDPEVLIIGGGIANAGPRLFVPLQTELDRWEWRPTGEPVEVVPAALGEMAGALGAARFAMTKSLQ